MSPPDPSPPQAFAALVVVDMQNGFCHPEGGLALAGVDNGPQQRVVPRVAGLVDLFHELALPVLWSQQVHLPDDVTRRRRRIPSHLDKRPLGLCHRGTWDAEIVADLAPLVQPQDHVFVKHRSSCFFDTTLDTALRMLGVDTIVVCGVATNYCVESTIRDGYARDYDVFVVPDAVASSFADLHEATLKSVRTYYGRVGDVDELRHFLHTGRPSGWETSAGDGAVAAS